MSSTQAATVARLVLRLFALIYFAAFFSLYVQVPGLYSSDGILPVEAYLRQEAGHVYESGTLQEQFAAVPSLIWLPIRAGERPEVAMELVCLLGVLLALAATLSEYLCNKITFFLLWALYFSLHKVGQTFLWFQWDSLVCEAGVLMFLLAPLAPWSHRKQYDPRIAMTLVRWLFCRLCFASGVVKLTSMCPTWWDLSALYWHFESQCIPNPVAWYARLLPAWMLRFGVASTYMFLMAGGLFAMLPIKPLRVGGCFLSIALQILIILTGNFNFFNLVTIFLCIPMLADEGIVQNLPLSRALARGLRLTLNTLGVLLCLAVVVYWGILFNVRIEKTDEEGLHLAASINFGQQQYLDWVDQAYHVTSLIGAAALSLSILASFTSAVSSRSFPRISSVLFHALCAVIIFLVTLVPFSWMARADNITVPALSSRLYSVTQGFDLANSYGLFRRMTGVGGRPEVVVEMTSDHQHWTELDFRYKTNHVTRMPPLNVPHQPRLDWQMWFAALGSFNHNPWLINFLIKVMDGSPSVLSLLPTDTALALRQHPPVAMRMQFYTYHFTTNLSASEWWTRTRESVYMTELARSNPWCESFQQQMGYDKVSPLPETPTPLSSMLTTAQALVAEAGTRLSPRFGADAVVIASFWMLLIVVCLVTSRKSSQHTKASTTAGEKKHPLSSTNEVTKASGQTKKSSEKRPPKSP
eukprot:m.2619 g.2619  ORF g.2619 m.2619 type:complete len:696 (+) comp2599_c0_seq1:185-2272(+)